MATYSVSLAKIIKDQQFEPLFLPKDPSEIFITTPDVHRPGLTIAGYDNFFDCTRINFLGKVEVDFVNSFPEEERFQKISNFMSKHPACIIISRNLACPEFILELAPEYGVPVLRTADSTSRSMASLIAYLNVELAERITRHGVFVEVYGEGVLILGDSGVGKSETAVELIKRGHRLVADDAVEIKKTGSKVIVGSAPDNIRHFIELRGIGIIDVKTLFGVESVKDTQSIDIVIKLEDWDKDREYDRLGLEDQYTEFLGNKVVCHKIPVRPGRNLAVIVESAAVNYRQKKMGYNAAQELYNRVQDNMARKNAERS